MRYLVEGGPEFVANSGCGRKLAHSRAKFRAYKHLAITQICRLDALIASLQADAALQRRRLLRSRPGPAKDWRGRNLLEVQLAAVAALQAIRVGLVESVMAARRLDGATIHSQTAWRQSLPAGTLCPVVAIVANGGLPGVLIHSSATAPQL